ncbi:hypothetical protein ASB62_04875 [Chlorobium limicola]|uniref:Transposase n=1 Tax=Chlorobium limicola TaxID=1092 RepID=A0A101JNW3_CHLLI|nr:hypothetical protein ASB62_04875 [Chlorobium limicola]
MMVGYAFHVGLFHSLLFAGFYRRFLNVPETLDGFKRYVSLSVLAYNMHRFGALLLKQDMRRYRRRQQNRAA